MCATRRLVMRLRSLNVCGRLSDAGGLQHSVEPRTPAVTREAGQQRWKLRVGVAVVNEDCNIVAYGILAFECVSLSV